MILHSTIIITSILFLPLFTQAKNLTRNNEQPNKSKRFLANQMYNQGEAKAVLFYMENPQQQQNREVPELQTAASSTGYSRNLYPASGKPLAVVSVQQPIQVFEQDAPKQVAEQQVLYEFQQTPNNAVSNVQVKQLFQPEVTTSNPFYGNPDGEQLPTAQAFTSIQPAAQPYNIRSQPQTLGSSHHPATAIISPVHQNIYNPNQGLTSFSYNNPIFNEPPQYPIKQQQQIPGKSIYLNGKIVYNPAHHIIQQGKIISPDSIYNKGVYHNQQKLPLINNFNNYGGQLQQQQQQQQQQRQNNVQQQPGINYYTNRNSGVNRGHVAAQTQGKLAPNSYLPPITKNNNRFQPPKHLQQIDKPSAPVHQQQEDNEDDDDAEANNEENETDVEEGEEENDAEDEDDDGAHRGYGDDDSYGYETFQFEDEYLENDDAHFLKPPRNKAKRHRDEYESDYDHDDEDRRTTTNKKHPRNHSRRYRNQPNNENYGFYEGYSTNMKYKSPKKNSKNKDKPIGKYKKVKFSRVKGGKPKVETIEGRFSEQVPVTHRQKLYKERWYVTQDLDKNKKTV